MDWHLSHGAYWRREELPPEQLHGLAASGHGITVLPATASNWLLLASQGAPSILDAHPWPGPETPWAHQRKGAEFCLTHDKCLLALPMGAGKTLTASWAALTLLRTGAIGRIVVVAPISIAGHVWERQLAALGLRAINLCGTAPDAKQAALRNPHWQAIIINPDGLVPVERRLHGAELIIVDEARCLSNPSSQRSRLVRRLHARRLWLMTGTPTPNSPMDALGYLRIIRPESPITKLLWQRATMRQVGQYKWVPRKDAAAVIAKHVRPCYHVPREQCYDVPDVQEQWLDYTLTPEQQRMCDVLISDARAEYDGSTIAAINAAALMSKLMQVETGAAYVADPAGQTRSTLVIPADDYFGRIDEFVREADTPVLVFASFTSTSSAIHAALIKAGHRAGLITGATPQSERLKLFDAVQAGTLDALVALPETAAHGITLTAARYVLWATPTLKNEMYQQGNARVVRPGQINNVIIAHLYGSKRSETIYRTVLSKGQLQDAVLSLLE